LSATSERIENVDRDRTVDQRRVGAREHDQRVDAVERRPAGDVDEVQRRVRCLGERCKKRLRQQAGDLLHAQPDQRHVRRGRDLAVYRTVEAGRQVVGAELEHVGRDTVEVLVVRGKNLPEQRGAPRRQPHEQPRDNSRHAAVAAVPGEERIPPRRAARGIVRKRECRMRDIDDRQSEAVGGGREHYGAVVSGRKMGLHDRLLPRQRIFSVTRVQFRYRKSASHAKSAAPCAKAACFPSLT
jgi:hypothetical protein